MPFKLRLKKTRQYNVVSRNVLVLSVELVDKTTLECTLSSDSTGYHCLHNVCQRLNLQQSEFFGLRYMSKKPYPKVRWVELDRPLKKQLEKYAQSPNLTLSVMYYIHDVGALRDDVARSQYFLQVKRDVLEGKIRCNFDQAILLASYSLQAEFGDHQRDRHTAEYLKDFMLFPKQVVSDGDLGTLLDAVVWQYSSLQGLAQDLAETYYILEAQRLDGYGQETFMARDNQGVEVYLGASLLGIMVRPAAGHTQVFYRWNDISNLTNHKRNFDIESQSLNGAITFTFDEPDAAKYIWKMCVKQHTFYKKNQVSTEVAGVADTRGLAIPDLQSSVMGNSQCQYVHDLTGSVEGRAQSTLAPYAASPTTISQYDVPYITKSPDSTTNIDTKTDRSYGLVMPQPLSRGEGIHTSFPIATPVRSHNQLLITHTQPVVASQQVALQNQKTVANTSSTGGPAAVDGAPVQQQVVLYSSNMSLPSTRGSVRRHPELLSVQTSSRFICPPGFNSSPRE